MALITVTPIVLKNAVFKVAADNYESSVSSVEFQPSPTTSTWKGLAPTAQFTFAGNSTWVAAISFAQDWETEDSLSAYLFDHEGESIVVDFYPEAGGQGFRATVSIVAGSIGGAVDSVAVATVSLPVQGKPARIVTP